MTYLVTPTDYKPREQASCSSVKLSLQCERAWFFRYVLGIKEPAVEWSVCREWTKPKPKLATKPTHDEKEAVKYFNRTRRKAIGKTGHHILELWVESFRGGPGVPPEMWHDIPGRVVTAGLGLIPHPSMLEDYFVERKGLDDFVERVTDGVNALEFNMYLDLVTVEKRNARMLVTDYKTTSSFDWIKTPQELQEDTQGICYPLDVMLEFDLDVIDCRWIYFLTEGAPKARAVDFVVTRDAALKRALPIVNRADELINTMRLGLTADEVPANTGACDLYGGCIYHTSRGGPCTARPSWGKILRARHARTKTEQENRVMAGGFRRNAVAAGAIGGGAAAAGTTAASTATNTEQPAGQPAAAGAAQGAEAPGDAASGAARRRGGTRRAASTEEQGTIHLSFEGGTMIELPPSSPFYAQAVAIYNAFHPEA